MKDYREEARDRLTAEYAADRIGVDEYERRVEAVSRAASRAELERLLADLPSPAPAADIAAPAPSPGPAAALDDDALPYRLNRGEVPRKGEVVAVFSSVERRGDLPLPRVLEAVAVFGSNVVDLRNCPLPPQGARIEAVAVFGSLTLLLPPGVAVRLNPVAVLGSAGGATGAGLPGAPVITVEAVAVLGSVEIKQ